MRHAGSAVYIHLVWATWDRLPLIDDTVQRSIYRAIGKQCEEQNAEVIALGGIEDHVHLFVKLPTTLAIADLIKRVKGATTHLMTHVIAPESFFKWQGAYGAVSVLPHKIDDVCHYINHQREHHTEQTCNGIWELPIAEGAGG